MISVGFRTDKGVSRAHNEDSVFVLPDRDLYMVADGVGGQNSGELASRMAVSYMAEYAAAHPIGDVKNEAELRDYFMKLLSGANELIFVKACRERKNEGMATTALLCYIRGGKAYFVNVGDSRAYLVRSGRLFQITRDHTIIRERIDNGELTPEQAKDHPDRHAITRAVGGEPKIKPDFYSVDVFSGDTIVLCTDGLYGEVGEDVIAGLAGKSKTMHGLAKDLVDSANMNGGGDNISVVCIRIQ